MECSKKNAASCVRLARMHHDGFAVAPSKANAAAILKSSCEGNRHARSCYEYGFLVREGWMFEVERNADDFNEYGISRARAYSAQDCPSISKGKDWDACLVGAELTLSLLDLESWPDPKATDEKLREKAADAKKSIDGALGDAKAACKAGHGGACWWLKEKLPLIERRGYSTRAGEIQKEAERFENACKKGDDEACTYVSAAIFDYSLEEAASKRHEKLLKASCARGSADSCFLVAAVEAINLSKQMDEDPDLERAEVMTKMGAIVMRLFSYCDRVRHDAHQSSCAEIAEMYLGDQEEMLFGEFDPKVALKIYKKRCANGFLDGCKILEAISEGEASAYPKKNAALAVEAQRQVCLRSPEDDRCDLCSAHKNGASWSKPKDRVCRMRLAWKERVDCDAGKEERCEVLATMYQESDGVPESSSEAVRYYRVACDSALKSSCSKLKDLCAQATALGDNENCKQSLIHTDVFYEAEWQFRQTGSAKVLLKKQQNGTQATARLAEDLAGSGAGVQLKRGSLDADLVVSIVLDRARQAAIRLVVRELSKVSKGRAVPTYLKDLMLQAGILLSDASSMRQEKFQDLAMTVVRAFVASNLIRTIFATNQAMVQSPLWVKWAAEAKVKWNPSSFNDADTRKLHSYLTNWVYYGLSGTKLFGRPGDLQLPTCPFRSDQTKVVCQLLTSVKEGKEERLPELERLSEMLKIDAMLEGLSLAKALREQGSIDLRRLIEAIGHSETIADFRQTPGLNLEQWKKEISNATEIRLRDMQAQLKAATAVFEADNWTKVNRYDDLRPMLAQANLLIGKGSPYLGSFSTRDLEIARGILSLAKDVEAQLKRITEIQEKLESRGASLLKSGGDSPTLLTAEMTMARGQMVDLKRLVMREIAAWSGSKLFIGKIEELRKKLVALDEPLTKFRRSAVEVETILGRYKPPRQAGADITVDVEPTFEVAHVPLYALPELLDQMKIVATNLKEIDDRLAPVFPGSARPKLKFAISAVVRLLGFLDMMERVARSARLSQTCGEVMSALRLLGKIEGEDFAAPLFDVMDPILHAIKTHEPMNVDLLFTIISEVRLDSLLASLSDKAKQPCTKDDEGFECWTFKIIHSLQESVNRKGNSISLDGGAFAKRLASHGDDFRRKHKWRGYFHLTVGLGGLYSSVPDSMGGSDASTMRSVPLVGEQVGFGWASPSFLGEAATFKTGVYGSGLLYRAALDSAESNAIMVSPFVALDLFDLLEVYAGPMALFYPPTASTGASLEWGAAAGVTVPLSAYLERL